MSPQTVDVVVIGAGQSGLAVGYYLRRTGLSFVLLDEQPQPGGAWQHGWDSLHLFSPADASSLPGWLMPRPADNAFPRRDAVIEYLTQYEQRYTLPVRRPVEVARVAAAAGGFTVLTDQGTWQARAVVCATGSWSQPFLPTYPGLDNFRASSYTRPFTKTLRLSRASACSWWGVVTPGPSFWPRCRG